MNISDQLLAEMSRRNIDFVAGYVGDDSLRFKELTDLVFHGSAPLPLRASWVIAAVTDKYPELMKPYVTQFILHLNKFDHPGVRRNLLRYLASAQVPEEMEGILYDLCYKWVTSRDELPANRVHSMQILFTISQKEPDLKRELQWILEELTEDESAAIRSRSRKLCSKLKKNN